MLLKDYSSKEAELVRDFRSLKWIGQAWLSEPAATTNRWAKVSLKMEGFLRWKWCYCYLLQVTESDVFAPCALTRSFREHLSVAHRELVGEVTQDENRAIITASVPPAPGERGECESIQYEKKSIVLVERPQQNTFVRILYWPWVWSAVFFNRTRKKKKIIFVPFCLASNSSKKSFSQKLNRERPPLTWYSCF